MLLNEKTKQMLRSMQFSGGRVYLLCGGKGIGRMTYARYVIADYFNIQMETLLDYPDYYELHSEKTLGVGDLSGLWTFTEYMPACGACKVAVIDTDALTDEAQASLLKLLEDGATHVMFILILNCRVLDTIRSRCREISFLPVESVKMDTLAGNPIAKDMAFGKPGLFYALCEKETFLLTCKNAVDAVLKFDRLRILQSLHLVKEKDKEAFFECYGKGYALLWLRYLMDSIQNELSKESPDAERTKKLQQVARVVEIGYLRMSTGGSYSKNDFFEFVHKLCVLCM